MLFRTNRLVLALGTEEGRLQSHGLPRLARGIRRVRPHPPEWTSEHRDVTHHDLAQDERASILMGLYRANHDQRLRLSRDLHDHAGQQLAGLLLGLKLLSGHVAPGAGLQQLDRLCTQVNDMAQDLHRVAYELRPMSLHRFGLSTAVSMLLDEWKAASGVKATYEGTDLQDELPPAIEITLFRIAQEALANISKHAGSTTRVDVSLSRADNLILLTIEDNGRGFDPAAVARRGGLLADGHLGLASMRERLALVGGQFQLFTRPGCGTTIQATIPLPEKLQ
jgi:signal transduction histidine kinase